MIKARSGCFSYTNSISIECLGRRIEFLYITQLHGETIHLISLTYSVEIEINKLMQKFLIDCEYVFNCSNNCGQNNNSLTTS